MDTGTAAAEMHALFGGDARAERDDLWACVLLGVYSGLDSGEAGVSALQAGDFGAAYFAAQGVMGAGGDGWGRWAGFVSWRFIWASRTVRPRPEYIERRGRRRALCALREWQVSLCEVLFSAENPRGGSTTKSDTSEIMSSASADCGARNL